MSAHARIGRCLGGGVLVGLDVPAQVQALRQREQQHQPDAAEELEVDPGGGREAVGHPQVEQRPSPRRRRSRPSSAAATPAPAARSCSPISVCSRFLRKTNWLTQNDRPIAQYSTLGFHLMKVSLWNQTVAPPSTMTSARLTHSISVDLAAARLQPGHLRQRGDDHHHAWPAAPAPRPGRPRRPRPGSRSGWSRSRPPSPCGLRRT